MWGSAKAVTLLYVAVALSEAAVLPYKHSEIESVFLGTVDGKSYFADDSKPMSWEDAKTFCASIGMRLAGVETVAQKEFLVSVNNTLFKNYYWTAGRDAMNTQQFVWDHNSVWLSENFDQGSFTYYMEAKACVLLNKMPTLVTYQSHLCVNPSSSNGKFGALCESI